MSRYGVIQPPSERLLSAVGGTDITFTIENIVDVIDCSPLRDGDSPGTRRTPSSLVESSSIPAHYRRVRFLRELLQHQESHSDVRDATRTSQATASNDQLPLPRGVEIRCNKDRNGNVCVAVFLGESSHAERFQLDMRWKRQYSSRSSDIDGPIEYKPTNNAFAGSCPINEAT